MYICTFPMTLHISLGSGNLTVIFILVDNHYLQKSSENTTVSQVTIRVFTYYWLIDIANDVLLKMKQCRASECRQLKCKF